MDFLHGTCHAGNNYDAFRDLGLNSMRLDIPYPFASPARDIMRPEDVIPNEIDNHGEMKWCFGWDTGEEVLPHTFELQGRYITEAMEVIRERAVGQYYYHWGDSVRCACGQDGCPMEANWGLADVNGDRKPSYYALRKAIGEMKR